jgi:hypothetical protein
MIIYTIIILFQVFSFPQKNIWGTTLYIYLYVCVTIVILALFNTFNIFI